MDTPNCPTCSKPMHVNHKGQAGDPAYVCTVDDAAHRAAAAARKAECEALLRAAKSAPAAPDPDTLAAIGAWSRPDPEKCK